MSERNEIVLVPTDFTPVADFAINQAVGTAKKMGYKVVLLHIIKSKKAKVAAEKKLAEIATKISSENNVVVEYDTREGSVFSTIAQYAEQCGANMMIFGTHGKTGFQHVLGSSALKLISSAGIPVIVVQKDAHYSGNYNRIVLPLDSSPSTRQKFKWAVYLAKRLNSELFIISPYISDEFARRKFKNNLAQVEKILQENQIKYQVKLCKNNKGGYANIVLEYAKEVNGDLVMIVTTQYELLPGYLMFPIDDKVIYNKARVPVMCVNPKDLGIQIL